MRRIAIVAGELSGDRLGAGLIAALKSRLADTRFYGIAGPRMRASGCETLFPAESLSVMGIVEVLGRFRELLSIRKRLIEQLLADPPDLFIGIDYPGFNLEVERRLHRAGVQTVHYVSPQVWAWREGRVKKIRRSVDLMLVLFPFEQDYYQSRGVRVEYVGHPLADEIPLLPDRSQARKTLGLPQEGPLIALLPGSRSKEWKYHGDAFVATASYCLGRCPDLRFVVPLVNDHARQAFIRELERSAPALPVTLLDGQSQTAITAADVVLTVSGTATLECLLLKRPMVNAYRMAWLSYRIAVMLVKLPYYTLPNLLAAERVVPEFIQHRVNPEKMGAALLDWLDRPEKVAELQQRFTAIHGRLKRDASARAAAAIHELLS